MQNFDDLSIRHALARLGKTLPLAAPPKGRFLGAKQAGSLVSVSGQVSRLSDGRLIAGRAGEDLSTVQVAEAAEIAMLNVLSQLVGAGIERVDQVQSVLRVGVFVAAAPTFIDQTAAGDGASNLLISLFADRGWHSRAAVGVMALPGGAAVEVEAIFCCTQKLQ